MLSPLQNPFPNAPDDRLTHPCCAGRPPFTMHGRSCLAQKDACIGYGNVSSCRADSLMRRLLPVRRKSDPSDRTRLHGDGQVHVAFAIEGDFLVGLLAAVASLVDHSHEPHHVHIHIYADCRSFPTLQREMEPFWCAYRTRGVQLTLHEVDAMQFHLTREGCPTSCVRGVFANYVRFYLPALLDDVDKVLWVDSDALVLGDVVPLLRDVFRGEHHNRSLAGVLRRYKTMANMVGITKVQQMKLGLTAMDIHGPTINAGLVALNLRAWRHRQLTQRLEVLIAKLPKVRLRGFSGMSTVQDSQTPMILLMLNATPIDIAPLNDSWNVDGLGWKWIDPARLCAGNYLHWSGKHKPWSNDLRARYRDIWLPYRLRVARAQARYHRRKQPGGPWHDTCSMKISRAASCVATRPV